MLCSRATGRRGGGGQHTAGIAWDSDGVRVARCYYGLDGIGGKQGVAPVGTNPKKKRCRQYEAKRQRVQEGSTEGKKKKKT